MLTGAVNKSLVRLEPFRLQAFRFPDDCIPQLGISHAVFAANHRHLVWHLNGELLDLAFKGHLCADQIHDRFDILEIPGRDILRAEENIILSGQRKQNGSNSQRVQFGKEKVRVKIHGRKEIAQ